jgi:hypothetical protein
MLQSESNRKDIQIYIYIKRARESRPGQDIWTKYFTELCNDESRQINDKEKYKVVLKTSMNKL